MNKKTIIKIRLKKDSTGDYERQLKDWYIENNCLYGVGYNNYTNIIPLSNIEIGIIVLVK